MDMSKTAQTRACAKRDDSKCLSVIALKR